MEMNKKDKNKEYLKNMTETEKTFSYLNKYFILKKLKKHHLIFIKIIIKSSKY